MATISKAEYIRFTEQSMRMIEGEEVDLSDD